MNYLKREFSELQGQTFGPHEASPQQRPNWTISYRAVAPLAMAFDALTILLMSVLSGVAYNFEVFGRVGSIGQLIGFGAVVAALFIALAKTRNLYILTELLNFKSQARRVTVLWLIVFVFLTAMAFIMKAGENFSRGTTLTFAISGIAMLIVARGLWRIFLAAGLAASRFSSRKVALISEQYSVVDRSLDKVLARHGLQIATHFVLPAGYKVEKRWKEIIAQTISSVRGSDIEEIVVSADLVHWPKLNDLMPELRVLPLPVSFIPVG
jgi:putative colanic acid biosynthesis UDP-glucose lipid carrier transferase